MIIESIRQPRVCNCSQCGTPMYQWDSNGFKNHDPSGKKPYFDGDSLPLCDMGLDDIRANTFDGSVSVGKCFACNRHFYEFTVTVVNAKVDNEFKDAYIWNPYEAPYAMGILQIGLQTWDVMFRKLDEQAPHVLINHVLGVFDLPNPESVMSSAGVSICTSVAGNNPFDHGMAWVKEHQTELIDFAYQFQNQKSLAALDWINWIKPTAEGV